MVWVTEENNTRLKAIIAGSAWTKNIFLSTVMVPKSPAVITHIRKNIDTLVFQIGSEMQRDQINPAARNPL